MLRKLCSRAPRTTNASATGQSLPASPPVEHAFARSDRTGWLAAGALAAVYAGLGVVRWSNWWSGALDIGIFDQGLWLMAQGRAPEVSIIGSNLFADHLSPVLLLYVPLYRLAASPVWLIVTQAACLGLTVLPMRALARQLGARPGLATAGVALSAPLLAAAAYDFHPVVMAAPLVAWALVAARADDVRGCTWAGLLLALVRADAVVMLLGVAVLARPAARRRLLLLVPLPLVAGVVVPELLGTRQTFERYYGQLGQSPLDAVSHPWRLVSAVLADSFRRTAVIWLAPVGFLTLFRPRWALALLVAGAPVILSSWPGTSLPWFHHAAVLVPFALGGALAVLARPSYRWQRPPVLVAGAALALLLASPLSPQAPPGVRVSAFVRPWSGGAGPAAAAAVGDGESVSAANRVLAHLGHRRQAHLFPCPFEPVPDEGMCPDAGRDEADAVDVVIVEAADVAAVEDLGYEPWAGPGRRLFVGR